jgi:hypothetical protein
MSSKLRRSEFARGARAAAGVAAEYEKHSSLPTRLSDRILCRLNLSDRQPRKNPHAGDQFWQGYALALAHLVRTYGEKSMTCDIMLGDNVGLATLKRAGVDDFDLVELKSAVAGANTSKRRRLRGR